MILTHKISFTLFSHSFEIIIFLFIYFNNYDKLYFHIFHWLLFFCILLAPKITELRYFSTDRFRLQFIKDLNKYRKVDVGGKKYGNIGRPIVNKLKFFSSYKFSIAMENSEGDGYNSEKLLNSFQAGTIPIYYGDYMIDEFINPKTYILIDFRGHNSLCHLF